MERWRGEGHTNQKMSVKRLRRCISNGVFMNRQRSTEVLPDVNRFFYDQNEEYCYRMIEWTRKTLKSRPAWWGLRREKTSDKTRIICKKHRPPSRCTLKYWYVLKLWVADPAKQRKTMYFLLFACRVRTSSCLRNLITWMVLWSLIFKSFSVKHWLATYTRRKRGTRKTSNVHSTTSNVLFRKIFKK